MQPVFSPQNSSPVPMAPPQPGSQDRRPPPLGLRGLSRVAFQRRSPPPRGLPPLGLAGRAPQPSFSIGTAGFERAAPPSVLPLSRPSRPPAPNEAGSSNWMAPGETGSDGMAMGETGSGGTASGGSARSSFVGFSLINGGGGISFGGSESMGFNFSSGADGIRIGYRGKGYNANFAHADEYPPM